MADEKSNPTVQEAGRLGGKKGGKTTKERYGNSFYKEIGRRGGERVRETRGRDFYEAIGRKGGRRVRELIEQGKRSEEARSSEGNGKAEETAETNPELKRRA